MRVVSAAEALPAVSAEPTVTVSPTPTPESRRTIRIGGSGSERNLPYTPVRYQRSGFSPDRLAMWAVLLGFLLVLVAILSAQF
jgi:hypothetical protein